ncbi:MAG: flagellar biosynthesis protein FlhF [Methylibium sp.]|uniref:Flagellar biosynthesis protein FlhF n=1 Tax=Methylibium petroleiphilum (strain ATCC BAA-1232 / LMG 22953 / PM1) TaxID=420662 RepID=A2SKE3_METPP|nr:flagellar biosynthesis protein FlhF [Methylibium petroleiphilum]ABM96032.1 flagellar GTP-binding protein [Methylibium petroleiphilum PM1]
MNVQRFTGRTSRDAMTKMRQALGDDAVVLSTKPCPEGIEMLAMAPGALAAVERQAAVQQQAAAAQPAPAKPAKPVKAAKGGRSATADDVQQDVEQLSMSTLSFQDYVRDRMLKKREAALRGEALREERTEPTLNVAPMAPARAAAQATLYAQDLDDDDAVDAAVDAVQHRIASQQAATMPVLREQVVYGRQTQSATASPPILREAQADATMLSELRSMKGLIEERFGALAFMEKLQREPAQAKLTQKLLECGFSPVLIRKLVAGMTADVGDEQAWAASVLERNLMTGERELPIEDQGGVFAMIGATGVGKTTSTAKLAAAFATRHGASNLGLITLDAYRLGAHEQLRAYGRILGVPVHTAHDRTALEDLLELLSAKKMVLIDTAGVAQRDTRTRELLDMLAHPSINKLLVVNTAVQGETIDDVMTSYRAAACKGIVLSKLDEAVKLAPALDAVIRHKQKIVAVANGQRVPEDWHRLSGQALVHRALRATGSPAYNFDASEMNLVFATPQMTERRPVPAGRA